VIHTLADTSFLIDLMLDDASAIEKAQELERAGIAISVGASTIFELYVGVSFSKKAQKERSKIISTISGMPQLPLDNESAIAAGLIYGEKRRSGATIDPEDAMLAGISKVRDDPVLTRNVKHFSNIEGVKVESY
jgi:tRNA(fMet)-specific endonuclease VapC